MIDAQEKLTGSSEPGVNKSNRMMDSSKNQEQPSQGNREEINQVYVTFYCLTIAIGMFQFGKSKESALIRRFNCRLRAGISKSVPWNFYAVRSLDSGLRDVIRHLAYYPSHHWVCNLSSVCWWSGKCYSVT